MKERQSVQRDMADYYYGSARIRALENALIGRERIARLLEARDCAEVYRLLEEYGVPTVTDPATGRILREETLLQILETAYHEIANLTEENELWRIFLYPYDCNNVKATIKCSLRGVDPTSMYFPFGTVDPSTLGALLRGGDLSALPSAMAATVPAAREAYAATKNPQKIDLLLDRACYTDMLAAAGRLGNNFATQLIRTKIDLLHVMMTVRILRMHLGEAGALLLSESMLPPGTIPTEEFLSAYAEGEEALWRMLSHGDYEKLARSAAASDGSLTTIELFCDDAWMERVREARSVTAGGEVLVGYLIANEYAVRNVRMILAGKEAGLPTETIRERIRESYV